MSGILVHPGATLGAGFKPSPFSLIDEGVRIGDDVAIGSFVHVHAGAAIGSGTCIGDRVSLGEGVQIGTGCVIKDGVVMGNRCRIGDGVELWPGVIVENDTDIGARSIVQAGAYLCSHTLIEGDCFVGPMVVTTNDRFMGRTGERFEHLKGCTLRRGARVGGGAHVLPGVEVGEDACVAAASVVTHDVPAGTVVMGSPARVVRDVPGPERLEQG